MKEAEVKAQRGLLIVNTGHGKGKTTAALGTVLRAWGQGLRVCVIQFIKSEAFRYGEAKAAERLGLEWHILGDGCTFGREDLTSAAQAARQAWAVAQERIASGRYDLILLDELTYPLRFGWLDPTQVLEWLEENRPPNLHIIITGRDALPALVEAADLVTDMRKVKHPFDKGIKGQRGIEF